MRAIAKDDGNFQDAQVPATADDCLERDFKTGRVRREFEEKRSANGEEAAHRIVHARERIGERGGDPRQHSAPSRPAGRRRPVHVTTANDHIRGASGNRAQ